MVRELKDSGVQWIGKIPSDWKICRLKDIYTDSIAGEVIDKSFWNNGTELLYTCQKNPMLSDYSGFPERKRTQCNDLLLTRNATPYIFIPEINSIYSNVVQKITIVDNVDKRFVRYVLKEGADALVVNGNTIPSYNMGIWSNIQITLPSYDEQKRIADFLDIAYSEIDTVIEKTKVTIEEYKKLKLTVITETVTKGIRGDRPMKDSGIEWIGDIPQEWENRKMLSILSMRVIDGPHESPELYDEGIPYISANAIENGKIDFSKMRGYISEEYCEQCDKRYKPQKNDILVIKLGATTGQVALVDTEERFNIWVPLAAIRCNNLALPKFVYYAMQSNYYIRQIENSWTYGTQQTLGVKTIERLRIIVPNINEQKEISDFLDVKCAEIDKLIADKTHLLEEMESYKKSVIYEYVTGKKEVVL